MTDMCRDEIQAFAKFDGREDNNLGMHQNCGIEMDSVYYQVFFCSSS